MPTILINTNLNSHRQKTSDSKNNLDSNVIQYDDMDDDFRQDINLIITKLLNKSKTLDSFTIKYDLEDTIQRQGQSDSENTDQKNHQTNCICNRMARLFNDLLQPTSSSSSSSSSTSTNNSNTSTNERSNETDLRHIYKEIKLLRKYQFDLNSKFNLLIDKLDTKQNTNSPCAPSSHNSTINTSNNNNNINNNNNNNKQQSPQSVKLEPKINLTGAKKRKFNSFKSFTSNTTPAQDPPRSASVTSSSSSDTSSSSHTSTSTDLQTQENNTEHNENESLMLINEAQEDSSNVDLELDDEQNYQDQEEVDDYENYDEQKNFKYQIPFPRFQNFKFPYPYTPTTNQTHQTSLQNLQQQQQHQHTPQKNVLSSNLNQSYDLDLNELFKGNGPKYLQLESYKNFKAPIVFVNDKYYVDDTMAALSYSKSKSRRNFAAHLTKLVFTPRERLESNCNGRFGKKALDSVRLLSIRNTIFKYYPCKQSTVILNGDKITSGDYDENSVWVRDCIPAIDESNRVLKKQLVAWYKKNNPSILIRHNTNTNNNNNNNGQNVGLSPSTSASTMYNNTGYLNANNMDDNEGFDDVDEC